MDSRGDFAKGCEKTSGVIGLFTVLIVTVSQVSTMPKAISLYT